MRDRIKDKDYFDERINNLYGSCNKYLAWIANGEIVKERINSVKQTTVWNYIQIVSCKYSANYPIVDLRPDLFKAIDFCYESWDGFWKVYYKGKYLNQLTLDAYDQMLWMLSLGYLLDISNDFFQKLVAVIDRYQVKDFLFEFIIRAKIKDRQSITEESYQRFFGIPDTFSTLRQAITENDKQKAEALVKQFITKEWYKKHKDAGWRNSHKSIHDTYSGYWCFEAAAIVKIMELDDSSFRDSQYYPKDLVNF